MCPLAFSASCPACDKEVLTVAALTLAATAAWLTCVVPVAMLFNA
ncbi:MAG TPA: hypothetical protein VGY98_18180 [Verrucomicrobiae bacterium]|nr:hypothetical protein [Verrucomicrobiae bacterium]